MRMRASARMGALVVCSGACACLDFKPPLYELTSSDGLCSNTILMESHHEVWTEGRCDGSTTGWKQERTTTGTEVARVQNAFLPLFQRPGGCADTADAAPGSPSLRLEMTPVGQAERGWDVCRDADGAITTPFAEAVSAMQALAQH